MARNSDLTMLEQATMLAIMRQHPNAYGVSIRDEIETRTGTNYSFGSIYATLERLEKNGLIEPREGEVNPIRGGRRKLYFTITGTGRMALSQSLSAVDSMRSGIILDGVPA